MNLERFANLLLYQRLRKINPSHYRSTKTVTLSLIKNQLKGLL